MATTANALPDRPAPPSLKDELAKALPSGFECRVRYIRTPAKPCDPLFSASPGSKPEKTTLSSHFLTVSVDSSSVPAKAGSASQGPEEVISFAIEVLVYATKRLTTIFVSKIDSTSYITRQRPSPVKRTATTFLKWLADSQLHRHPGRKVVISLFARAQAQYLFPGSSDDRGGDLNKHTLDDRQLIKWWAQVLDPILPDAPSPGAETRYRGFLTVPGYEGSELRRSFMPPNRSRVDGQPYWLPGHPLLELARARGVPEHAPPRCLLPRFPDDPKARYIAELDEEIGIAQDSKVTASPSKRKSGRWNSVHDLRAFWETMEFRQECSSGRVVGFLWLVISPKGCDDAADEPDDSLTVPERRLRQQRTRSAKRRPLSGPIVPRAPRIKGVSAKDAPARNKSTDDATVIPKDGYDKAMQTLLNLDFSNLPIATQSTRRWISEVRSLCRSASDFAVSIAGSAQAGAPPGTHSNGVAAVNDLGMMVRKKRKAGDADGPGESAAAATTDGRPAVNVLSAGMIRKKPKPAAAS